MNLKKFFKTFVVATLVIVALMAIIFVAKLFIADIGSSPKIEALDKYKRGERKNVLVLGTDKSGLRSDVMMVFSFSSKDKTINSVSIPRDTRVELYGKYQKINAALAIGQEELAVQAVKDITGIPIHEYVKVNFQAVSDVVDVLGGVVFDVPQNMRYSDPAQDLEIDLEEGEQLLDGDKALQLLRFRRYPMGDLQRVKVQQEFMKAAFEQKFNLKYIFKIGKVFEAVEENISSSLTVAEVTTLARQVLGSRVDGVNTLELPTYMSQSGVYVIVDQNKIDAFVEENFK